MDWKVIEEFPGYSVSSEGQVRNDRTGRTLTLQMNQHGTLHAGLMRHGRQYKRAVPLLVAEAFLEPPPSEAWDTPINLDGDRFNNSVDNLMWRPRWFAIKYHRQFPIERPAFRRPIVEARSGDWFADSSEAVVKYGILDFEIFQSAINNTYVWPTYQEFRLI